MQSSDARPCPPHSAARHYCQMQFMPLTFMSWQPERYQLRLGSSDQGMNGRSMNCRPGINSSYRGAFIRCVR